MLTNLRASQYVNPSAALSAVLNQEAFATMGPSTLQQIACIRTEAILVPSLWVGSRLASRPVFRIEYENETREAQLTSGGYLRLGLKDFMPRHESYLIFEFSNHTLVYLNGTLLDKRIPQVHTLGLPKAQMKVVHYRPDPILLAKSFRNMAPPHGLDYLHSAVEALASMNEAQLSAQGIPAENVRRFTTKATTSSQNSYFLNDLYQAFVPGFLSSFPIFFKCYQWASLTYTTVTTALVVWMAIAFARRFVARQKRDKAAVSAPTLALEAPPRRRRQLPQ